MPWIVMAPGGPYHQEDEPEEMEDGRLLLHSGQTLAPGTWTKRPSGKRPQMPRASVPPKKGRPERKDRAGGWGEDNLK
jgi:hypothetical protein